MQIILCTGGSSPRMRGAHGGKRDLVTIPRIIPADAGSTNFGVIGLDGVQDHPRGCGEHK